MKEALIRSHDALQADLQRKHETIQRLLKQNADYQRENELLKRQLKEISIILRKGIDIT
jgi:cell shape-determining protein MreC